MPLHTGLPHFGIIFEDVARFQLPALSKKAQAKQCLFVLYLLLCCNCFLYPKLTYQRGAIAPTVGLAMYASSPLLAPLKAKIDSLQISGRQCCTSFLNDWLSHPDHVHPDSSDFSSSKIYPKPFGDLGMDPVVPLTALVGLIQVLRQIFVCLAAAISLFAMWCAVKARENTTHISPTTANGPVPGAEVSPYNAAASANMAVWFFFEVWIINTSVFFSLV